MIAALGEGAPKMLRQDAQWPGISPDGKSMVFVDESGIWVSGVNGETPRKLVSREEGQFLESPVWSRDGRWIAYWTKKSKGADSMDTSIVIQPATGGSSKTLVSESNLASSNTLECGAGGCLCWLLDQTLVFDVKEPSEIDANRVKWSLWQVRVDPDKGLPSQRPQRFTQSTDFRSRNPTTTADGKILAFTRQRWNQDVYIGEFHPVSGVLETPRRLTLDNHDSVPEAWLSDNRSLLFTSDRNGGPELFKQGLSDSIAERIVSSAGGKLGFGNGLSPDGTLILYWQFSRPEITTAPPLLRLMRQPVAGGPPETVLEPSGTHPDTDFSCPRKPGNPCVLSSSGSKKDSLGFYALDPVRGKGDLLGEIKIDKSSPHDWTVSTDGSQIAVVDLNHKDRIEILDLSSRTWHEIAVQPGWGSYFSVAGTAEGNGFFLSTMSPDSFNVVRVSPSGKVKPLLNRSWAQVVFQLRPSPDGKYLAFQGQTVDSNVWLLKNF